MSDFFFLWVWWLGWWIGDYDGDLVFYFVCGFGCVCVGGTGSGGCGCHIEVVASGVVVEVDVAG